MLGLSLLTSKGPHGVPGSAVVILATTLNAAPLIGNCVGTVVVAWKGDLERTGASRHQRHFAPQQAASLFDHLASAGQE